MATDTETRAEYERFLLDNLREGDDLEVRDAYGEWHAKVARSRPYVNSGLTGRVAPWLVVAVDLEGFDHPVNWPAVDVRLLK